MEDEEDLPDEEIYMSNVSALRGTIEPIYAARKNLHEESIYSSVCRISPFTQTAYFFMQHVKDMSRDLRAQELILNLFRDQKQVTTIYFA